MKQISKKRTYFWVLFSLMVSSVVLMTVVNGVIYQRVRVPYLEEKHVTQ